MNMNPKCQFPKRPVHLRRQLVIERPKQRSCDLDGLRGSGSRALMKDGVLKIDPGIALDARSPGAVVGLAVRDRSGCGVNGVNREVVIARGRHDIVASVQHEELLLETAGIIIRLDRALHDVMVRRRPGSRVVETGIAGSVLLVRRCGGGGPGVRVCGRSACGYTTGVRA